MLSDFQGLRSQNEIFPRALSKTQGRREGGGREAGGGGGIAPATTLLGPQLESESLKFSSFFKLLRVFLKLRPREDLPRAPQILSPALPRRVWNGF